MAVSGLSFAFFWGATATIFNAPFVDPNGNSRQIHKSPIIIIIINNDNIIIIQYDRGYRQEYLYDILDYDSFEDNINFILAYILG